LKRKKPGRPYSIIRKSYGLVVSGKTPRKKEKLKGRFINYLGKGKKIFRGKRTTCVEKVLPSYDKKRGGESLTKKKNKKRKEEARGKNPGNRFCKEKSPASGEKKKNKNRGGGASLRKKLDKETIPEDRPDTILGGGGDQSSKGGEGVRLKRKPLPEWSSPLQKNFQRNLLNTLGHGLGTRGIRARGSSRRRPVYGGSAFPRKEGGRRGKKSLVGGRNLLGRPLLREGGEKTFSECRRPLKGGEGIPSFLKIRMDNKPPEKKKGLPPKGEVNDPGRKRPQKKGGKGFWPGGKSTRRAGDGPEYLRKKKRKEGRRSFFQSWTKSRPGDDLHPQRRKKVDVEERSRSLPKGKGVPYNDGGVRPEET